MTTYLSPIQMFYKWEKERPNDVFMRQPVNGKWLSYTWKEAGDQARRMATVLKNMDMPAGSRIALVSKNCAHWVLCDLAIMMAGHISVPIYPNVGGDTLNYVVTHSEAPVLFVGKLDSWKGMAGGLPAGVKVIAFPEMYGKYEFENWDTLIKDVAPLAGETLRQPDELMTIIYTSGTTGQPKGVMQTFHALSYAVSNALAQNNEVVRVPDPATGRGRFFSYLPLSHIAERLLVEMGCLYSGSEMYFAESLDTFAVNLAEARPTIFLGVPRIWSKFQSGILAKMPQKKLNLLLSIPFVSSIVKNKIKTGLGLDKANHCLSGASPIPPSLILWFGKLGINIQEAYGMTENCAYSHINRKANNQVGTVGQPMPLVDVKIGDNGEIWVKSEASMKGYYKNEAATAETFTPDGYLKTGDKGEIGKQGHLKITGRVKELFKTEKGKYVAPAPIEMIIQENADIEQSCVVGVGLPQPIALISLQPTAVGKSRNEIKDSLSETLESVNKRLEAHERLKKLIVVKTAWTVENNLLTPSMKIKRGPIEDLYKANYDKWYGEKDSIIWE
ncbi:MAG: AMP-binding protein [Chitinophagales bacterium]|nr:AMP-binding protein [Chitinophagales bacterium]